MVVPGTAAADEIGNLSRSFASLLGRLHEHTDYLRTLASKLTHELRTPLAIVTTSVDNLEHEVRDERAETYLSRLRQGTQRLDSILTAMSAATRVEQAIEGTVAEVYDLAPIIQACTLAYRDVYPERNFSINLPPGKAMALGSADLLAQLLDKLVENAVSFSEPDSKIEVAVVLAHKEIELNVSNRGPALPESMRRGLFDSLVSVRTNNDDVHLGLGLYIVALIMKFHNGRVTAENLKDRSGVVVRGVFSRDRQPKPI